jgi:ribosome-associated protein
MPEKIISDITYPIRLGQLLKHIDVVQNGFEAKLLIQSGNITVNGVVEKRRGRQLTSNDVIQVEDGTIFVLK